MFNLQDFQVARKAISEKRGNTAESVFEEALKILESYKNVPSITKLEQIGKKLVETINFDKEYVPAYLYLSFVFYALGNEEMALKYIRVAESINDSEWPKALINYKEEITKKIAQKFNQKLGSKN